MDQHCTGSTPHPTARQINMPALSAVEMPALSRVEMPALSRVEMQNLLAELTSGNDTRAENSISALTQLGRAVIPALLDLTHAKEADTRWWAVRAPPLRLTLTVDLLPLASDSAPEVRAATASLFVTIHTKMRLRMCAGG